MKQRHNGGAGKVSPAGPALWYAQPAQHWSFHALPLGNGRMGAMVFGGMKKEHIQFNEHSLWLGDEQDTGAYQAFGDLYLEFNHPDGTQYRRELDIARAVHTIGYTSGGVQYKREYFASHPAGLVVLRFTADKPGSYSGTLTLTDMHEAKITAGEGRITASGSLAKAAARGVNACGGSSSTVGPKGRPYTIALDYESQVLLRPEGGKMEAQDGKLIFTGADALTVLLAAGTDFVQDRAKGWHGAHPHPAIVERMEKAAATPYQALLAEHIKDYQSLFGRLSLSLGASPDTVRGLPTDKRLGAYRQADPYTKSPAVSPDPELESLLFQYGRYLMISCSRRGDLPANLQGVWNNGNAPAWRCDYHSDINVQMNYWFVDMANLPGCFEPLSEWLWSVIPVKREATRKEFKIRGFACRSENGLFGGASYHFVPGDAAWIAQNIWDHYAFTQDRKYLETRAYPILKELCEFWEDYLKERADGKLVSRASISPEHGPAAEGNSYEQQLVYDLFTNYIEASKVLGKDEAFRKKVESMRKPPAGSANRQVGATAGMGQRHRQSEGPASAHVAPARGLPVPPDYPGFYARFGQGGGRLAGRTRRNGRCPTRVDLGISLRGLARLAEAERAYHCITGLFAFNVFPNLLCVHPPLQLDGNFGYPAAVGEMLLQSYEQDAEGLRVIRLLPALPKAWPNGSVKGIRARGGFTADMSWQDGKVADYRITSPEPKKVRVQIGTESKVIQSEVAR